MTETTLVRTCVGRDGHTLVLRESPDEIPVSLLVDDSGSEDVLAVTYGGPRPFLDAWRVRVGRRPRNVGVVSVGTSMRATSTKRGYSEVDGGPQNVVRGVTDPTNSSAVHRAVGEYLASWPKDGRTVVYFDSVNALVEHLEADDARDVLDGFLRSVASHGAVCYSCLTVTDGGECLREIRALFDTVVEFDGNESRSRRDETCNTPEPSVDDCFAAIEQSIRRRVLLALRAADGALSTTELVDRVTDGELVERQTVRTALVQRHLPKLSAYGFVAHDHERVARGPHFGRIRPYLRIAESEG